MKRSNLFPVGMSCSEADGRSGLRNEGEGEEGEEGEDDVEDALPEVHLDEDQVEGRRRVRDRRGEHDQDLQPQGGAEAPDDVFEPSVPEKSRPPRVALGILEGGSQPVVVLGHRRAEVRGKMGQKKKCVILGQTYKDRH